jgi:hypothetical protein
MGIDRYQLRAALFCAPSGTASKLIIPRGETLWQPEMIQNRTGIVRIVGLKPANNMALVISKVRRTVAATLRPTWRST